MPEPILATRPDIADMTAEDRRATLWRMPIRDLAITIQRLMESDRQTEQRARLDAISILLIRQT